MIIITCSQPQTAEPTAIPQWYLNLLAHPQATIQIGKKVIPVTAQTANAEERPRLWALFTKFSNFAGYERKTTREIPVVILTPTS